MTDSKYFIPMPEKICRTLLKYVAIKSTEDGDHNYRNYKFVNELYNQFMEECEAKTRYQHSEDRVLLNLDNYTLEFSRKNHFARLRHNPKHYLCNQLPYSYDPTAVPTKFLKYLHDVLEDPESIQLLKEFCGAIFARWLNLQYMMFLYGKGGNGKSVFMDILSAVLGKFNISEISLENFNKDCYLAELDNKLLNCNSDVGSKIHNKAIVKKVSSRETIDAKRLYHDPKPINNYGRIMFNTNEMPQISNNDPALLNRIKVIKFEKIFDPKTANTNLSQEIIDTELSGLLNWIIEGYNDICENVKNGNQFSKCNKSEQFLQEYRNSLDSVASFMAFKNYKAVGENRILLQTLFDQYVDYCNQHKIERQFNRSQQLAKHLREKLKYKTEKPNGGNAFVYYSIDDDI